MKRVGKGFAFGGRGGGRGCRAAVAFDPNKPGKVEDEAKLAGRTADSFPAADENYFHDMDGGYKPERKPLSENAIRGRNTWIVWTGGNDRFWDFMGNNTFGAFDLLKTVSSHPNIYANRDNRWSYLGLVNEPCFEKASGPDPQRWGLWLDKRIESGACAPDPFANADKYTGVEDRRARRDGQSRGQERLSQDLAVGSFYGEPSGVVGLRLFPNPDFDEEAAANWDAEQYYTDPDYYQDKDLVRPVPRGHVLCLLSCGSEPHQPARGPREPKVGQLELQPRRAVFLGRPHLRLGHAAAWRRWKAHRERAQLHLSAFSHQCARHARIPRWSPPTT